MNLSSATLKFSISGLRGVYPDDISPDKWVEYVRAFAASVGPGPIALARDARSTGPALIAIASGVLTLMGREVHELGLVPTPTIKAYVNARRLAGGLMVSASHNPANYNALKFIKRGGWFFDAADNEQFIRALDQSPAWGNHTKQGRRIDAHAAAIDLHVKSILKVVKKPKRKLKVVIDPVGSCGAGIAAALLKALGVRFEAIHFAESPQFERPPEPTADALKKLCLAVKKFKADVGFAFDPDADRLSLVDETGRAIGEEYTLPLAILATARPGGTIVANLSTSMLTQSAARLKKNNFFRSSVGEANVVAEMLKRKSALGGEGNGGVIDARVPSFGRDALTGMAHILSLLDGKKKLSDWVDTLPRFEMVKEIRRGVETERLKQAASQLVRKFDGILDSRDGFHVSGDSFWIHLRASNTEPVVRIIAEAQSREHVKELIAEAGL